MAENTVISSKESIFLLKIKYYFHFELRNLKLHNVSYTIKKKGVLAKCITIKREKLVVEIKHTI